MAEEEEDANGGRDGEGGDGGPTPRTGHRRRRRRDVRATCLVAAAVVWVVHVWITTVAVTRSDDVAPAPSRSSFLSSPRGEAGRRGRDARDDRCNEDCELARAQSLGYFDDTPSSHWKTLQKYHAALFPNYYDDGKQTLTRYSNGINDRGRAEMLRNSNSWYGRNFQVEFVCPLARRLPSDSMADGPKWVCDPHRIAKQKDCLVYSVGSNGKAEFEKAVIEEIGSHCEVHTFDPVDKNKRNGDFATALRPYSKFHHWGFADEELARTIPTKYKTLRGTMEELGHVGRTIDIFKIDCEWCEWFTWREWLTVDMRQILVETHNAPMPNARDFFFGLHDAGYAIFSKEANYENGAGGVEYAFVKLSTDFFVNDTLYYKRSALAGVD